MNYALPRNYDAWRTSPPPEPPARNGTLSTSLCIETGDVQIDAIGTYDAGEGALISVRIDGIEQPVHVVEAALAMICPKGAGTWSDDLDEARLNELCAAALQDERDNYGDHLRDLRVDR